MPATRGQDGGPCLMVASCPLFPLFTLNASLAVWKSTYCDDDWRRCQRWLLAQEGQDVPPNVLPNGRVLHVDLPKPGPR